MNPPPSGAACPRCGAVATHAWHDGLCPACTLEFGLLGYDAPTSTPPPSLHLHSGAPGGTGGTDGTSFGDYLLFEELGAGGMGVVHRALQISLNRVVAMKRLRAGPTLRGRELQRFRAEAAIAAKLRHPHIVAIHEVGEVAGQPYFTMEYVDGQSLAERLRAGPIPPTLAARYLRVLAEAIGYAHRQGVLHRDLKPSNLLIDSGDHLHILDFGLAKLGIEDTSLTATGTAFGSPSYMSPEQAAGRGGSIDARCDIYGLGAVLYEMLTGRPPFRAATVVETLRLVVESEPAAPRSLNPLLPVDLETICLKCLAKSPAHRYPTAEALVEDLGRFLEHRPIQARRTGLLDRGWLWARRQPAIAALTLGLVAALVAGFGAVVYEWRLERQQRLRAEDGEHRAKLNLFAADMNLAAQAIEDADVGRARQLLEPYHLEAHPPDPAPSARSTPSAPPADARGFEWFNLWHETRPDPHRSLLGHRGTVVGLALGADPRRLFSVGSDGTVQEQDFNVSSATSSPSPSWTHALGFHASSLSLHPDGRRLAIGGDQSHGGLILDRETGEILALPAQGMLQKVAFSPSGHWLACGSLNGWATSTGTTAILDLRGVTLLNLTNVGGHVTWSRDGRRLATGSWNQRIKIWNLPPAPAAAGAPPILELTLEHDLGPAGDVSALAFSPDGAFLASGNATGELLTWELATGQRLGRRVTEPGRRVQAISYSPNGESLATGVEDPFLRVWDSRTLELKWSSRGHLSAIWDLAWTADHQALLSASGDGSISVWPTHGPPPRFTVITNIAASFFASALAFSPDSRWIAATLAGTNLGLWEAATGAPVSQTPIGATHLHAAFAAQVPELFVAVAHGSVRRFSVPELKPLALVAMEPISSRLVGLGLSEDARFLVAAAPESSTNGSLHLWNARTGKHLAELVGHERRVLGVRFSPDLRWLASGSLDQTVRLWDLTTFREIRALRGAEHAVTVLSFSPDGRTLATGGWDAKVRLWSIPEGKLLTTFAHWDSIPVPEFLPDGKTLSVMVAPGSIRLLNLASQRDTCVLRWPEARIYRYLRCSPDGQTLAAYSQDGRLRLWQAPRPPGSVPHSRNSLTPSRVAPSQPP